MVKVLIHKDGNAKETTDKRRGKEGRGKGGEQTALNRKNTEVQ